jgi:class 3 adenylate cyclase/tetratricopeptide (TPR) repeat protein
VLFGDLVGFTTLSEARDAEEVRELLSRYFAAARTVIDRYGGTVEKFIGDAVMAVWGVPTSHEDDAERAVRAGFDLIDAVAALGEEVGAPGLAMRVGIVTSEVAVTLGATGEGMVAGDAVNTAARIQAAAEPGQVLVDEATRQLTVAAVAYSDAGAHELKGKAHPVQLFKAQQIVASMGGLRRVDGLEAPFTGRDRELRLVKELFHATVEEGRPRLVNVVGPVGVGKSRLGWEFEKYTDGINAIVRLHGGRCLSYGEGVAFWALSEIVRGRLGVVEGDHNDVLVAKLHASLDEFVADPEERAWLLPRLATLIGAAEAVSAATFARDDLFAAWRTFLERVALGDAVAAVIRIDDLQWADAGLIDFLENVLDAARAPIFILTLSRPETADRFPAFGTGRRATTLYLERLAEPAMSVVIDGLVEGLPADVRDSLVAQSEGIPLFAVETVRSLIDRDAVVPREGRYVLAEDAEERVDLHDLALPTSLHTLIAARLDALPPEERRTVQDAAVLGQAFTRDALVELQSAVGSSIDLDAVLPSLVRKELFSVESDPRSPERGQHRFVQAVVRGVAYDTLSRRDRKVRHLAVADYLSGEPDADTAPALLASHLVDAHAAAASDPDAADIAGRAVQLLQRAATHALDLGAPTEACSHLASALALVHDEEIRARLLEQAARAALSAGRVSESIQFAEQGRAAFEKLGSEVEAYRVLAFWAEAHIISGSGSEVVEPLSAAYERLSGQPAADAVVAQLALQLARAYYLSIGETEAALPWFERAMILGEALEDLPLLASTLASYAGAFVLIGRQRMGIGLLQVSLDLSRQLDQPKLLLRPLNNLTCFLATRDVAAARKYAEEGLAVTRRLGDREWGLALVASSMHVLWTDGDWDGAQALVREFDIEDDTTSVGVLVQSYVSTIRGHRGEPWTLPLGGRELLGMRTDLNFRAAELFLNAARSRADGDVEAASDGSFEAVHAFMEASGIDDDFPLFLTAAVEDAFAVGDLDRVEKLMHVVSEVPIGHVPPYVRLHMARTRAMLAAAQGRTEGVEAEFTGTIAGLRAFGAPFYVARTQLDYGRWLIVQGRAEEATAFLADAESTFSKLRAMPFLSQVEQLKLTTVG